MKLTVAAILGSAFLVGANANCLTYKDASTIATNFGLLVSNYSQALANLTLTPNFVDYSESVNSLIDNGGTSPKALLGQTVSSRASYESASAAQPSVPFMVKNLWYTCDTITARWESDQSPQPVIGISVFHTVLAAVGTAAKGTNYKVDEIWGEFDSASWLVNAGVCKPASKMTKREMAFSA